MRLTATNIPDACHRPTGCVLAQTVQRDERRALASRGSSTHWAPTNRQCPSTDPDDPQITSETKYQDWTLDGLGNFGTFDDDGTAQDRTVNEANEIQSITGSGGWVAPVYDLAGNMTSGPQAGDETTRIHYVYDAWNRLVAVYEDDSGDPGDLIVAYEYDGGNRRIEKVLANETGVEYYYNQNWQLLESRSINGFDQTVGVDQYAWDLSYIDSPVVQFHDGNADGDCGPVTDLQDAIRHYTWDANHNVTSTITTAYGGTSTERYVYDAYGAATVYDADWTNPSPSSLASSPFLYCGYFFDAETANYLARHRYYNSSLATWISRDPTGYDGNDLNLYRYCDNRVTSTVDPHGTTFMDYVTKLSGGHIYKAVGGSAGGILQLATWITDDVKVQAGVETGVYFFPDTCEIGIFSIQMGIVKGLDPKGGPSKVAWEGGLQLGLGVAIEVAYFTGPGWASAGSFSGIFYTGQGGGGPIGVSGYKGVPDGNGAYWFGGTIGAGVGIPIQVGTVAWNYQLLGAVKVPYCPCLAMIYAMP
jgi:RHS repeat-associated protein